MDGSLGDGLLLLPWRRLVLVENRPYIPVVMTKESGVIQGQLVTEQVVDSAVVQTAQATAEPIQGEEIVSFQAEMPLPLHQAMADFIERCPNWDQYRLV